MYKIDTNKINIDNFRQIEEMKKQENFLERKERLADSLNKSILETDNKIIKEALLSIQNMADSTEGELELKEWLYNYGDFRTVEEISDYNQEVYRQEQIAEYEEEGSKVTGLWFFLFIPLFMFVINLFKTDLYSMMVYTFPIFIGTLIICCLRQGYLSNQNVKRAKELGINPNHPIYKKDLRNAISSSLLITGVTVSAISSAKKSREQLYKPSTWEKI